jgi:hypothetical protein
MIEHIYIYVYVYVFKIKDHHYIKKYSFIIVLNYIYIY